MMKKLGVTIYAPRDPYESPELVHIEGTHAAVMATIAHLNELVQVLNPHICCLVLPIEPRFYTKILGRQGSNLFKLLARHWGNIVIPDSRYSDQGIHFLVHLFDFRRIWRLSNPSIIPRLFLSLSLSLSLSYESNV